jgi:hypothetical protein
MASCAHCLIIGARVSAIHLKRAGRLPFCGEACSEAHCQNIGPPIKNPDEVVRLQKEVRQRLETLNVDSKAALEALTRAFGYGVRAQMAEQFVAHLFEEQSFLRITCTSNPLLKHRPNNNNNPDLVTLSHDQVKDSNELRRFGELFQEYLRVQRHALKELGHGLTAELLHQFLLELVKQFEPNLTCKMEWAIPAPGSTPAAPGWPSPEPDTPSRPSPKGQPTDVKPLTFEPFRFDPAKAGALDVQGKQYGVVSSKGTFVPFADVPTPSTFLGKLPPHIYGTLIKSQFDVFEFSHNRSIGSLFRRGVDSTIDLCDMSIGPAAGSFVVQEVQDQKNLSVLYTQNYDTLDWLLRHTFGMPRRQEDDNHTTFIAMPNDTWNEHQIITGDRQYFLAMRLDPAGRRSLLRSEAHIPEELLVYVTETHNGGGGPRIFRFKEGANAPEIIPLVPPPADAKDMRVIHTTGDLMIFHWGPTTPERSRFAKPEVLVYRGGNQHFAITWPDLAATEAGLTALVWETDRDRMRNLAVPTLSGDIAVVRPFISNRRWVHPNDVGDLVLRLHLYSGKDGSLIRERQVDIPPVTRRTGSSRHFFATHTLELDPKTGHLLFLVDDQLLVISVEGVFIQTQQMNKVYFQAIMMIHPYDMDRLYVRDRYHEGLDVYKRINTPSFSEVRAQIN